MGKLKLFVSHSSRLDDVEQDQFGEDHNWKLLSATCEKLKQCYGDRIELLVDQDEQGLYPSCDWEQQLNEWLAECHAAVILFSKRARETSYWVKKEATILSWRREVEENFPLIPVLLQGQTAFEDLAKDIWSILHIEQSQCKQSAATCNDIVSAVKMALGEPDMLASQFSQTPFERLLSHVSALLSQDTEAATLEAIWEGLPDKGLKPVWHSDRRDQFATALTRYMVRDAESCLDTFRDIMDKLRPNPQQEKAREMLRIIRAFWVDAKAAALIPKSRKQQGIIAMNGRFLLHSDDELGTKHYTIERYLERAWPDTDLVKVIPITITDCEAIKTEIRNKFGMQNVPIPSEQIDQLIRNDKSHLLIYLDVAEENGGLPDSRQLSKLLELRVSYPRLIIILAAGEVLPPLPNAIIAAVTPLLDLDIECQQFFSEKQVNTLLDTKYGNQL
ncbi:MAG: hypothetical protein GXP14_06110 [Gammaproteobacteria bacterium]|nr:hypothetical protein [Gammaproteobacteria bacterium]